MDRLKFDKLGTPFEKQWENERSNPVDVNEKAAGILVTSEYAENWLHDGDGDGELLLYWNEPELDNLYETVNPFEDTLEGRRQADAIEDWLWFKNNSIYSKSFHAIDEPINAKTTHHQWRLDRIKWCLQELIK